ncbi:MAG TPA: translation elongation factor Ts [Saprospiraceae bacterium]|nr:translation elongation factor Ts [Saprospiraceae bacterium]HMP24816.1 translation elongation factor Ts [Saprospiraceae bacterium]
MSVTISAADVKKLRDMTGAGMSDCKSALVEAEGDYDKAIELLRKKGQKLSLKRADREATEGAVIALVSDDHKRGVVVKLSSETDFVAKNEGFVNLAKQFAELALQAFPSTKDEVLALGFDGITIGEKVIEQTGVIGEKIELAAYERLEAEMVAPYIHMGNKAGVLVGFNKALPEQLENLRSVAMQVAAMKPIAVDEDGISQEMKDKEVEIRLEASLTDPKNANKPKEILEKIARGSLNKFFQEVTLLNQDFVKENGKKVREYLTGLDKDLTVTDFKHVTLG